MKHLKAWHKHLLFIVLELTAGPVIGRLAISIMAFCLSYSHEIYHSMIAYIIGSVASIIAISVIHKRKLGRSGFNTGFRKALLIATVAASGIIVWLFASTHDEMAKGFLVVFLIPVIVTTAVVNLILFVSSISSD